MNSTKRRRPRAKAPPFPLRRLLENAGITCYALSARSGISYAQLYRLAKGGNPTWAVIYRVLSALRLTVDFKDRKRRPA